MSHWGHFLPVSCSLGNELLVKLGSCSWIEHSDRRHTTTKVRSTFILTLKHTHTEWHLLLTYKPVFQEAQSLQGTFIHAVWSASRLACTARWWKHCLLLYYDPCPRILVTAFYRGLYPFIQGKANRTGKIFHLDSLGYSTSFNISYTIVLTRYLIWESWEH